MARVRNTEVVENKPEVIDETVNIAEVATEDVVVETKPQIEEGPQAVVHNGKTTYAIFTKAQYGYNYKEAAKDFAKKRNFDVRYE